MSSIQRQRPRIIIPFGFFQALIGIGAVFGGIGLMTDPTGEQLGMSLVWLAGSPFPDFLVPGIVLFTVNGLGTLAGSLATFRMFRYAGELAIGLGIFMVLWIVIQVLVIGLTSFLQPLYFSVGIVEAIGGWALRRSLSDGKSEGIISDTV